MRVSSDPAPAPASPRVSALTAFGVLLTLAAAVFAGPRNDFGHEFVVIGDPGNRAVNFDEGRRFFPPFAPEGFSVGNVNYKYRMARTEVTVGQWLEFVNAYRPYYDGPTNASAFTSQWIYFDPGQGQYRAVSGSQNFAADMSTRYAARYINWLHNDKAMQQSAFENGVYDTSTFGRDDKGNWTDNYQRSADAKFWIPDLDEWVKGMYWDPHKNDGEGGYWRYPTSSDTAPIPGVPGVGETSAGIGFFDVGSYPDVQSPWGLLDGSGGESEMIATLSSPTGSIYRSGSSWIGLHRWDEIDFIVGLSPSFSSGLRLAAAVPTVGSGVPLLLMLGCLAKRRRSSNLT